MPAESWDSFANRIRASRILVIGDLMLDEYIWGDARRISPEAPVPVVEVRRRTAIPGGAANTAANIVALGGQAVLAGVVGEDASGAALRGAIEATGTETAAVLTQSNRPTTTKVRVMAHNQQVVRFDTESRDALPVATNAKLLSSIAEQMLLCDGCVISDYGKGVVSPDLAISMIAIAREHSKFVIVDPKGSDYTKYRGATILTPNLMESEFALHREIETEQDLVSAGHALTELVGGNVLVTRGSQGMSLFEPGKHTHIPALARSVFDVTGAGDTVVGVLAISLAAGKNIGDAAALANVAAGIVVGKLGTSTTTLGELRAELETSEAI